MRLRRVALILIMTGITAWACSRSQGENFAGSGTLEATEVELSALLAGRVFRVIPHEGDMVDEGDTVVVLDTEQFELQREQLEKGLAELELGIKQAAQGVKQANIAYDAIEKNYNRILNLYEKNVATQSQYDEVKAKYDAAKAQLKQARLARESLLAKRETLKAQMKLINWQIQEGVIKASISGQVLERFIQPGEVVRQGQAVLTLADLSVMKMKVYLAEPDMGKIKLNDIMKVKVDAFPQITLDGTVVWISPEAEFTPKNVQTRDARAELVYAVKLEIENPDGDLKIGMPADAFFK
jgi:HlyD family secretion protein